MIIINWERISVIFLVKGPRRQCDVVMLFHACVCVLRSTSKGTHQIKALWKLWKENKDQILLALSFAPW